MPGGRRQDKYGRWRLPQARDQLSSLPPLWPRSAANNWFLMRSIPGLAILLLAALGANAAKPVAAPKDRFHWAGWEIPAGKVDDKSALNIVEDEEAESRRQTKDEDGKEVETPSALRLRVSRRAIARSNKGMPLAQTPAIPWQTIVPGVYELSARIKYSGDENIIGTPLVLGVQTAMPKSWRRPGKRLIAQGFHSFDIGEGDAYTTISMRYEIDPTLSKRLKARKPRHSWRYGSYLSEVYPGYKPKPPDRPPPDPIGVVLTMSLPQTKYSSRTGVPPNSLRSISLDWVKFERVTTSPGITLRHLRVGKRWLRPGENQQFEVGLENFNRPPAKGTLVLTLENGLQTKRELHRQEITLAPGAAKVVSVPWGTAPDTPLWGYGVRAEIRQGDRVDGAAHDVFSVHPRVYPVHVMGSKHRASDPFQEREGLANLMEVFAATPGDCAQIMPKADQWLCGMSTVAQSFKIVRGTTDYNRSIGVATHMYLYAGGTGEAIMDMYIRNPEFLSGRLRATDEVYYMREAVNKAIEAHDFNTGPFPMPKTPHIEAHMNHWFPDVMDRITKDTVEFVRRTGYDGLRFDVGIFAPKGVKTVFGEKLPFKNADKMTHAAANFNQFKDALCAAFPTFEFGANMDSWAYLENVGRRNEDPPPVEEYPEFLAFARAGGMFMDEGSMSAPLFSHYMNRYEDALHAMCQKRAVARRHGGVYQLFSPHRNGRGQFAHDDIYWAIMVIASGSHYVGHFSAAPFSQDSPGEFITRFSEFFRSPGLKPLPDAEDVVYVDTGEPLWYADAAVYEDIGERRRYVIPIINPPIVERFRRTKSNELPPAIDEPFTVEVQVPDGYAKATATMLTWEPRVAALPLAAAIEGGAVKVELPGIKLFRALVLELAK